MIVKSTFNHNLSIKHIVDFFFKIYRHDKIAELFSFVFWEIKYLLGFYINNKIKLNQLPPQIVLIDKTSISSSFLEKVVINWNIIFFDKNGCLYGTIKETPGNLYVFRDEVSILLFVLPQEIKGIYITDSGTLFVCAGGKVFRYSDNTLSCHPVFEFSTFESIFLPNAFTEDKHGNLFVGEYVNLFNKKWHFAAYVYFSIDDGKSWTRTDFLKKKGINKHIHVVKWSVLLGGLLLTDGDNKKKLWFGKFEWSQASKNFILSWKDISKRHVNMGGYTAVVEADKQVVFGTDYNGGTNFLVSTSNLLRFTRRVVPNPYRRSIFTNMVMTSQNSATQIWALLHGEAGGKMKSLLMMSTDKGQSWNRIIEYDGRVFLIRILNNSRQIQNKLYISIEKSSFEGVVNNIRKSESKTSASVNMQNVDYNIYTIDCFSP